MTRGWVAGDRAWPVAAERRVRESRVPEHFPLPPAAGPPGERAAIPDDGKEDEIIDIHKIPQSTNENGRGKPGDF